MRGKNDETETGGRASDSLGLSRSAKRPTASARSGGTIALSERF
jgi:hypothetical protein